MSNEHVENEKANDIKKCHIGGLLGESSDLLHVLLHA